MSLSILFQHFPVNRAGFLRSAGSHCEQHGITAEPDDGELLVAVGIAAGRECGGRPAGLGPGRHEHVLCKPGGESDGAHTAPAGRRTGAVEPYASAHDTGAVDLAQQQLRHDWKFDGR